MDRRVCIPIALGLMVIGAAPAPEPVPRSGIDRSTFDVNVRPQDDLFRHVNGGWLARTEIPADMAIYGAFHILREQSEAQRRELIEELAARGGLAEGSEEKKIADLYTTFMDEAAAEEKGTKPIAELLEKIRAIGSKADLLRTLAELERIGVNGAFGGYIDTDAKQSDRYILYLNQGGLGLPDELYYREASQKELREKYQKHIARMFELAGLPEPAESAEAIVAVETRLAKDHWDRVRSRDDTLTYNKKALKELSELAPEIDWAGYFEAVGAPEMDAVVVRQPSYFEGLSKALDEVPLDAWKAWLTWHTLRAHAPMLNKALVEENFDFYGRTLTGARQIRPRWKRAVAAVEMAMGEAVGKLYVAKHFPPEAKARMQELVGNLIEAYRQSIQELDWMSPETKSKALQKLAKFNPKIGYPDKWRDYSKLEIRPGDLVGNMQRAAEFEHDRQLAKLGKPVDRGEWIMTPQTVNAYYNPGLNEIVFPAAILQPPFFNMEAEDAVNYGGIGAVIGHEIGHGFDDQGSKFDGDGNMTDWWTKEDRAEFEARTKKLIAQYSAFEPAQLPGVKVNGALTIGENIGDLGGASIALKAYRLALKGQEPPEIDGLTGTQRFFLGWAQIWRSKPRDEALRRQIATDPHSPAEFRCNGVLRNVPEFYEAFGVKEGDKLYLPPEERVRIW